LDQISAEEASKITLASDYAIPEIGVDKSDPLGFAEGPLCPLRLPSEGILEGRSLIQQRSDFLTR
jgi:hypothetical protein